MLRLKINDLKKMKKLCKENGFIYVREEKTKLVWLKEVTTYLGYPDPMIDEYYIQYSKIDHSIELSCCSNFGEFQENYEDVIGQTLFLYTNNLIETEEV